MEENDKHRSPTIPLFRYWHTLRHLRPVQVYGRLWFRLHRPRPRLQPPPPPRPLNGAWTLPVVKPAVMEGPDSFRFLNRRGRLATAADWNAPEPDKLWLYNLHYFDDLNGEDADDRVSWHRALVGRWIAENPPGRGNGWEPYPTALRMVNWIKWALAGNALDEPWRASLAAQARWLRRRLEWHLLGNHLFADAKALVFAGLFFDGGEADRWLSKGLEILEREVPGQVLPDGGHFERSPMYHSIILEDLLDLVNAADTWGDAVPEVAVCSWREAAGRMLGWLESMVHPDGGIAFFNDAAFGIAPGYMALAAYADRLGIRADSPGVRVVGARAPQPGKNWSDDLSEGPTGVVGGAGVWPGVAWVHLADSGYLRLEGGPAVALLDVAPVGPDYLPGHAHADTLSFELSVAGQRVVVNTGTSRYDTDTQRLFERGTAAHNTVQVDGEDSSEVWGGFRVARRARPFGLEIRPGKSALEVRCAHDGYRRLPGRPVHWRTWRISEDALRITDQLEGRFTRAVARCHLHPGITVTLEGRTATLVLPEGRTVDLEVVGGVPRVMSTRWHPEFGLSIPNACIEIEFSGPEMSMELRWG